MFNRLRVGLLATAVCVAGMWSGAAAAEQLTLPGLSKKATIVRDAEGIAHIRAGNRDDLYYLQGWVHAEDRLFQMDLTRRQPSGTLAELFGPSSLAGDVQTRTIGLRRAAERSADVLSDETLAALESYTRGVNDWVMYGPGLPPEYAALGFTDRADFRPWNIIDSIVIGKAVAFSLSFDLDIGNTFDFQAYLTTLGPAGAVVFSQDVFRSQPFDCASTVPDATGEFPFVPVPGIPNPEACPAPSVDPVGNGKGKGKGLAKNSAAALAGNGAKPSPQMRAVADKAVKKLRQSEFIRNVLDADGTIGSNEWGVTRALGANGRPVIANDPHLALNQPSTFYPIGLEAPGLRVFGSSFPGISNVVLGHNQHIQWGATTNPMDVTDTFVELLVFDADGVPVATLFMGVPEPVELVPEEFFFNAGGFLVQAPPGGGIPAFTIIVPRRNNGPIIDTLAAPAPGAIVPALSCLLYTSDAADELRSV